MPQIVPAPIDAEAPVVTEPTLANVIARIAADDTLTEVRRRNVASSIRRFCAALGYEPEAAPATFRFYRERLRRFHPLAAGIQKKRWQTIKSDVGFALRQAGISESRPRIPLSPGWHQLLQEHLAADRAKRVLSRLARYCSARGIAPQDVDDRVIAGYDRMVREESFKMNPNHHHRLVCRTWNAIADRMPETGLRELTLPSYRETYSPAWSALSASFRSEAEAWLATLSQEADLLSESERIKPLRPASIKAYQYALRRLAGGLLHKGWPIEAIDSLAVLVRPDAAKAALGFFLDRNGRKTSSSLATLAHVLVLVAEAQPDGADITLLKRYRKQLNPRGHGMRPRPKNSLRPFTDAANIRKILILPLRIHERLRRKKDLTLADARLMQVAVALELLLMRPIRRHNIARLRLDQHVIRSGRQTFIVIAADEVKNEVELDYPIPAESAALLDFYVKRLLPLFGPNPSRWLFPGRHPDRPKCGEQFGRSFTKIIQNETGLYLYPHLMRHFGAYLYLRDRPGAFEVVRRVLGHKSLATTTRSYASFDDDAAVRMFDALILRIRDSIDKEIRNG